MPNYLVQYTTAHPSGDGTREERETLVTADNPDAAMFNTRMLLFSQLMFGCVDPKIKRVTLFKGDK